MATTGTALSRWERFWAWTVLGLSVLYVGLEGYMLQYLGSQPVWGGFAIAVFVIAAVGAWLALHPKNLAEKFQGFARLAFRMSAILFMVAVGMGIGAIVLGTHA